MSRPGQSGYTTSFPIRTTPEGTLVYGTALPGESAWDEFISRAAQYQGVNPYMIPGSPAYIQGRTASSKKASSKVLYAFGAILSITLFPLLALTVAGILASATGSSGYTVIGSVFSVIIIFGSLGLLVFCIWRIFNPSSKLEQKTAQLNSSSAIQYSQRRARYRANVNPDIASMIERIRSGYRFEFEGPPKTVTRWGIGAAAEEIVGATLETLGSGFEVAHDVSVRTSSAGIVTGALGNYTQGSDATSTAYNFDHIVSGPTGIWIVDTKNWRGLISSSGNQLTINGDVDEVRERTPLNLISMVNNAMPPTLSKTDGIAGIVIAVRSGPVEPSPIVFQSAAGSAPLIVVNADNVNDIIRNAQSVSRIIPMDEIRSQRNALGFR